ncbi:MAG: 3-dehydroquinate synthase, partial [Acutalibacteraceae bacterium]
MIIPVKTSTGEYNIYLEHGALKKAGEYLNLNRRVFIVTDSGVPADYSKTVAEQSKTPVIVTVKEGEPSKCFDTYKYLLSQMVEKGFTRSDCVVAVGGGVVGDMAGFAAASYMRGIDFYNIPTTVLSQVDSSVGGKVAIDFEGYKNLVGAFYPPKAVIIDSDTLKTLPERQISNGLAESVKMSLTSDKDLFRIFEQEDIKSNIDTIIERSLKIKRDVVEKDEKEGGLRKILNFGHTLAHAIESENGMENLYHGECVALGMIPMCSVEVRERLVPVL